MSVTPQPPPDESQIQAWQEQWDATANMFKAEIDFMNVVIDSKTKELYNIMSNQKEWDSMPFDERRQLRQNIIQARQELEQIRRELQDAKGQFISVNPQAEHYVQF